MSKRSKKRQWSGGSFTEELLRAARVAVEALLEEGRVTEARTVLTRIDSRYPDNPRVLGAIVELAQEIGDSQLYQDAAERLLHLQPHDAELAFGVAVAALENLYPVTSLQLFRHYLEQWPSHTHAEQARAMVDKLEHSLPEVFAPLKVSGEEALPVALRHERIQHLLTMGRTKEARGEARALHASHPHIMAVLNNLGQASWLEADFPQAEDAFRQVLASQPENVHALGNLARMLHLSGRTEEAAALARRLKASHAPASDHWLKVAETLSFLGDDAGVLEAFEQEQHGDRPRPPWSMAQFQHLAAVAALRLGDADRAEDLWESALERVPGLEPALQNLEALSEPVALRPAPWAFDLTAWLPLRRVEALRERLSRAKGQEEAHRAAAHLLVEFPDLRALLPLLLDRGSPEAVTFVLGLCELLDDVPLLQELKRFALGERGALLDRFQAARRVLDAGLVREEELLLWTGRRRQPYRWLDLEVSDEPVGKLHAPRVEKLLERALQALRNEDGARAERLLRDALALEPDAPDLLNNLAVSRQLQGYGEEAERMSEDILRRFPDYLFARCTVARMRARDGRLEEAYQLLEPVLSRRHLHLTELGALCGAMIVLLLAESDAEGAEVWLDMLERANPDEPQLENLRILVLASSTSFPRRLRKLLDEPRA